MADQLPCPNPTCTHVFTVAALQASAVVCPRCGFRMKGEPGPSKATPTPKPAPTKPASAKPALPSVPLATPVGGTIITAEFAPQPPAPAPMRAALAPSPAAPSAPAPVTPPRADGVRAALRMGVILGAVAMAFLLVVGAAIAIVVGFGFATPGEIFTLEALHNIGKESGTAGRVVFIGRVRNIKGTDEKAFRLLLAKDVWTPDKELRSHLGALGAWRNTQDDVWFAVAVKDFGTYKPRDAELVQSGMERLETHFGDGLELAAKTEPTDFAGTAAQKLTFKGQLGSVVWWGECIMLSHQGFGYWIFLAGPTVEDTQPLKDELNKEATGFALETDRKGWREQPPPVEKFVSSDGVLHLTAAEGVWEKATQANVEYETGTLLLLGRYLKERDNLKNAHLQSFTLDKNDDLKEAMKQAKAHLEKVQKEQNAGFKLAPVEGQSESGTVEDIGNRRGRVAELMLSLNEAPVRYYLVAVIGEAEQTQVLLCDCAWKSRQIWRQDFLVLLRTLKVKGKG